MSSAGNKKLNVTSWRWINDDGTPCKRAEGDWCLYRVRVNGELAGFVAVPGGVSATDALVIAHSGFAPEEAP